ncbi:MAG: hypothetical protein ABWJ42_00570, partial [Sulfolobales archaeon]
FYPSVGCCDKKRIYSNRNDCCSDYARRNLSHNDFMWCLNCGHIVYKDDYDLHLGHELYTGPCEDPFLYEETYVAD